MHCWVAATSAVSTAPRRLNIGGADGAGAWQMTGGVLNVSFLSIGQGGEAGALQLEGGQINVSDELSFGREAQLTAPPESQIRLTGTEVQILSQTPSSLADLVKLTLYFEPEEPGSPLSIMEVAGLDLGAAMERFENNFALGGLRVGSADRAGNVKMAGRIMRPCMFIRSMCSRVQPQSQQPERLLRQGIHQRRHRGGRYAGAHTRTREPRPGGLGRERIARLPSAYMARSRGHPPIKG